MLSLLAHLEIPFLLGAALAYLGAMLLVWAQLFLWPQNNENNTRFKPAEIGHALLMGGAVLHLLSIAGQGPMLFTSKAGTFGLFGWFLIVTYLIIGQRLGASSGAIVAPLALCATLYSLTAHQVHSFVPSDRLDTFWLAIHVFVILAGYVALAFAFAASLLYLVQDGLLKRRKLTGLWLKLPSLHVADEWIYRATAFGLALLTVGIFTGVAFNAISQPGYIAWRDPKVVFSGATWAVFALYIAARLWLGWHGRRSNLVVIYGFVLMAISFFGVPHIMPPTR